MKIIVLGMHHSGTSLASGLLSLSGVHFGKEREFINTHKGNTKGFWEQKDVRKLNGMLLNSIDCDWSEISNLQEKKVPDKVFTEFKSDASLIPSGILQSSSSRREFITSQKLQCFCDCLEHGEVPNIESAEIPISTEVHFYQYAKSSKK